MKNDNYIAMTEGVKNFLDSLGLSKYYEMFVAKGFDSERDLPALEKKDLDAMLIVGREDANRIIDAASVHELSGDYKLYEWLRRHHLEYYFTNFVLSGRTDLKELANLNLPDEELYDDLEITLPGHKKRLEQAVSQLRKKRKSSDEPEVPVAYGKWAKPQELVDAKYDFLCIDATIFSTKHMNRKREIEFMVDSGSDVVTIHEEILKELDLQDIGSIKSKGVHTSKKKQLYEARLKVGEEELRIEVISEEYNSLGSRVMRHFRHFISGTRHIWLKGDYCDPSMTYEVPTSSTLPSTSGTDIPITNDPGTSNR